MSEVLQLFGSFSYLNNNIELSTCFCIDACHTHLLVIFRFDNCCCFFFAVRSLLIYSSASHLYLDVVFDYRFAHDLSLF